MSDALEVLTICEGVAVGSRLGASPVEYTGRVDGKAYYFKSRWRRWRMAIADSLDQCLEALRAQHPHEVADFYCTAPYSDDKFAAGYMPLGQAEAIICGCVQVWRVAQKQHDEQQVRP